MQKVMSRLQEYKHARDHPELVPEIIDEIGSAADTEDEDIDSATESDEADAITHLRDVLPRKRVLDTRLEQLMRPQRPLGCLHWKCALSVARRAHY